MKQKVLSYNTTIIINKRIIKIRKHEYFNDMKEVNKRIKEIAKADKTIYDNYNATSLETLSI